MKVLGVGEPVGKGFHGGAIVAQPEYTDSPVTHDDFMTTIYGIANCDSVKKARAWLETRQLPFHFHDFKKSGVPGAALDRWIRSVGWEVLVNRRGTTWRLLDESSRAGVTDANSARKILLTHASLIKRPVVEWSTPPRITVGFDVVAWATY